MTAAAQVPETTSESGPKTCNHCATLWVKLWTVAVLFVSLSGCSQNTSTPDADSSIEYDLDLDAIKRKYQTATSYHDNAQVVLQYTLNGVPFEEVHPFSSQLIREGFSNVHRFKMQLVGNKNKSIARILDVKSQNLDGQVLCRATSIQDSWTSFSRGSIARHFARGIDDIPWNDAVSDQQIDEVLLIAEKLFLGSTPEWMVRENLVESTLVEVDDVQFVDAAFESPIGLVACRFDVHENALVGLRMPKKLLANQIASSPAVKDVSFAILFSNLSFDKGPVAEFRLAANESLFSQLTKLPESFPSPMIGQQLENWNIQGQDNHLFEPESAKGACSIYIYGHQNNFSNNDLMLLEKLVRSKPNVNFAWITPPGLPLPLNGYQFSRMGFFFR